MYCFRQDGWQMLGAFRTQSLDGRIQVNVQHIPIEEQQGVESLILG